MMAGPIILLFSLFIQSIASQMIQLQQIQPTCQSKIIAEPTILQQLPTTQPAAVSDYSIDLCKNLATAVQNMVLNKLTQSAYKKPIFNQIAGPLLNDITMKTQNQCPVCGNVNAVQTLVGSPCNQIQSLGNQIASYQTFVNPVTNQVQTLFNPLQNNQLQALVNPIQTVGNQIQPISYGNLNQGQSCPCNGQAMRLPGNVLNVQNQNQIAANAAQQKYSEAIAVLESLKNGNSCGCGQRSSFNLF